MKNLGSGWDRVVSPPPHHPMDEVDVGIPDLPIPIAVLHIYSSGNLYTGDVLFLLASQRAVVLSGSTRSFSTKLA